METRTIARKVWAPAEIGNTYSSAGLVVVEVSLHPRVHVGPPGRVGLLLPGVHELLGKPVAVVHVVPASAPDPIPVQVRGPGRPAASARGELALTACPADGVDNTRRRYGVGESCLSAGWGCVRSGSPSWCHSEVSG